MRYKSYTLHSPMDMRNQHFHFIPDVFRMFTPSEERDVVVNKGRGRGRISLSIVFLFFMKFDEYEY